LCIYRDGDRDMLGENDAALSLWDRYKSKWNREPAGCARNGVRPYILIGGQIHIKAFDSLWTVCVDVEPPER